LKIARVIPVYKKGPRTVISNYRPISLLSVFNKILEKLMYNRLTKFIEKHEVFFSGQFGFRSNRSTSHAILLITDKIQNAIENKLFSCGLLLDLSKAFDTCQPFNFNTKTGVLWHKGCCKGLVLLLSY
jgi:retron-type reverse transcriptase